MLINFRANLIDLIGIGIRYYYLKGRNSEGNKIQKFYQIWWESNLMVVKFT